MTGQILVTGGAGFVGANLVVSLLDEGHDVVVLDSLARPGSGHNALWLCQHPQRGRLRFIKADVRDAGAVADAVAGADVIYHLAGQVAVTASVATPRTDLEVNVLGTFNVLEAARLSRRRPLVVFTSTNKVYGNLEDMAIIEEPGRYRLRDFPQGIAETRPLDFHSPYGCSKGAADQYVRDYARIYDLPTVVFRMSCIYGPRQFGNEDQGWVAHFIIAAQSGRLLTIYGDGRQVRDVLYIDDLVRAFRLARERIDMVRGEVFNIGGGPDNALSVWHEFGALLADLKGGPVEAIYGDWRPGDQPCYVSDVGKARARLGWQPAIGKQDGIRRLWDWVAENSALFQANDGGRRLQAGQGAGHGAGHGAGMAAE